MRLVPAATSRSLARAKRAWGFAEAMFRYFPYCPALEQGKKLYSRAWRIETVANEPWRTSRNIAHVRHSGLLAPSERRRDDRAPGGTQPHDGITRPPRPRCGRALDRPGLRGRPRPYAALDRRPVAHRRAAHALRVRTLHDR